MVGLGLVLIFMACVYRLPGVLADVALVVYVLMLLGLLAGAKAVLTLPGIAGFVLSIGMAVDANVLIFERLKEELWAGKTLRAAVQTGFRRAFTAVFDSHVTTIVGAGVLFMLGTGTVKGFAYTLFWGTVVLAGHGRLHHALLHRRGRRQRPRHRPQGVRSLGRVLPPPELERRRLVQDRLGDLVRDHPRRPAMIGFNCVDDRLPHQARPLVHGRHRRDGQVRAARRRSRRIKKALATVGVTDAQINTLGEGRRQRAERALHDLDAEGDFGDNRASCGARSERSRRSTARSREIASVGPSLSREYLIKAH